MSERGGEPPLAEMAQRFIFSGRVQGVGFRYVTASLARDFPIKGYVRNRADGTVELVVQGRGDQLEGLLRRIKDEFAGNIENLTSEEIVPSEHFAGFEIRR